jgi:hypothetical protein
MNTQPGDKAGDGWRAAVPEIIIAAIVVAVAAVTGYAAAGLAGAAVVVTCAAVASLVVLRALYPAPAARSDGRVADTEAIPATFTGYWRKRAGLVDGTQSMTAYDAELRGTLERLLAARLAEHHGISLHDDPEGARRLLCPTPRDDRLWYWIDPARPAASPGTPGTRSGIPPRTLARLIDRLEKL